MLGSTIGPTFMAGVTVALLANIGFAKFSVGWRLANVVLGIVGVIYAIGMTFLPYTPRLVVVGSLFYPRGDHYWIVKAA